MKTRLWKIIFAVLLLLPVCANATTIDFYTDGTITDGNVFNIANIWDSANVTMTGGIVYHCNMNNSASLDFYDGYIGVIDMNDTSVARMYTDRTPTMYLYENSQVHLYNGELGPSIFIYDDVELHIYGYNLEYIIGAPDIVEGFWPDNQYEAFSILIRNSTEGTLRDNVFLHEIPEPISIFLFGLASLALRRS